MDHPDIPAGLKLPKRKKPAKDERASSRMGAKTPSSFSALSAEKQFHQRPQFGTTTTAYSGPYRPQPEHQFGYSWAVHPVGQRIPTPERRGSILSRLNKPKPLKAPGNQDQNHLTPHNLSSQYPPMSPYDPGTAITADEPVTAPTSQPSTPSWSLRDSKRPERALNLHSPGAVMSSLPPQLATLALEEDEDLALFAAATSGLSPDQPFQPRNDTPRQPSMSSSVSSSSQYPRQHVTSSDRYPSTSPSSQTTKFDQIVSPITETPNTVRAYQSLSSLPQSVPDLPSSTSVGDVFPPGHPLACCATSSSRASLRSAHSGHSIPSSAGREQAPEMPRSRSGSGATLRSFEASRASDQPPLPSRSFELARPSTAHPAIVTTSPLTSPARSPGRSPRPQPLQLQTNDQVLLPQPSPRSIALPPSANSTSEAPMSREMTYAQNNISRFSADTASDVYAPSPEPYDHELVRNSTISALSRLTADSRSFEGVSPVDPSDDPDRGELPNYAESQEEMARQRQEENTRRARELQRRWMQSTGRG